MKNYKTCKDWFKSATIDNPGKIEHEIAILCVVSMGRQSNEGRFTLRLNSD